MKIQAFFFKDTKIINLRLWLLWMRIQKKFCFGEYVRDPLMCVFWHFDSTFLPSSKYGRSWRILFSSKSFNKVRLYCQIMKNQSISTLYFLAETTKENLKCCLKNCWFCEKYLSLRFFFSHISLSPVICFQHKSYQFIVVHGEITNKSKYAKTDAVRTKRSNLFERLKGSHDVGHILTCWSLSV